MSNLRTIGRIRKSISPLDRAGSDPLFPRRHRPPRKGPTRGKGLDQDNAASEPSENCLLSCPISFSGHNDCGEMGKTHVEHQSGICGPSFALREGRGYSLPSFFPWSRKRKSTHDTCLQPRSSFGATGAFPAASLQYLTTC